MVSSFSRWYRNLPTFNDPLEHRLAPSLQTYMLALAVAASVWTGLPLVTATSTPALIAGLFAPAIVIVGNITGVVLLRRGRFRAAVAASLVVLTLAVAVLIWSWGLTSGVATLTAFSMAITLAGLLTSRRQLILTVAFCVGVTMLAWLAEQFAPSLIGFAALTDDTRLLGIGTFILTTLIVTVLLIQFGLMQRQLLQASLQREHELAELRDSLELQVATRTAQLEQRALKQERLIELVAVLETPTITVADGVVLAPIVGALDSRRAHMLTGRLLEEASARRAHQVILDITGVPAVDTQVVQALLHTAQALRLLGCTVILTGVSGSVATTIAHLGIDLDNLVTARSPQEALLA